MKTINLDFCDFHPGFKKNDNHFINLLRRRFDVQLCDQPEFLIYASRETQVHRLHDCVKIFYTVEAFAPDWGECDYALTHRLLDDPRHLRLPLYSLYGDPALIQRGSEDWDAILAAKKNFCAFVVGNAHPRKTRERIRFFKKLCGYKLVHSAGGALNNTGYRVPCVAGAKVEFLRGYKFNIAFENACIPGYTTEKLVEAMQAHCIPIYRGNPRIADEFNTASFLNYPDFPDEDALIQRIIELDRDDAKYLAFLKQPPFHNNQPNIYYDQERVLNFFENIFTRQITPVSRRRTLIQFGRWIWAKKNKPAKAS